MKKPKFIFCWLSSCGGCEESILDLGADLLEIAGKIDIVFWPVALDFKDRDLEKIEDNEILASWINGAVRIQEHEKMARWLRQKSQLIIAQGSCAHLGGVLGLANLYSKEEIFKTVFEDAPSLRKPPGMLRTEENGKTDGPSLPVFCRELRALDQVIEVDYYVPGCPATPELIKNALSAILTNNLPGRGSVLAETKALCDSCPLKDSKPDRIVLKEIKRFHKTLWDPKKCFLAQDMICLGPATRGGCGSRCIKANMPCRGCFGPLDNVKDFGAKFLSCFCSMMDMSEEAQIQAVADSLPDPAGLFYMFSLASSLWKEIYPKA